MLVALESLLAKSPHRRHPQAQLYSRQPFGSKDHRRDSVSMGKERFLLHHLGKGLCSLPSGSSPLAGIASYGRRYMRQIAKDYCSPTCKVELPLERFPVDLPTSQTAH